MIKRLLLFVIATGSLQAITFRSYYYLHEKELLAELQTGKLIIPGKRISSLDGMNSTSIPELNNLQILNLSDNDLPADLLDANGFYGFSFPRLQVINLINNPIGYSEQELREYLELPDNVQLFFKSSAQHELEQHLLTAVLTLDVDEVLRLLDNITNGTITAPFHTLIQIDKIVTPEQWNLLHQLAFAAGSRIEGIRQTLNDLNIQARGAPELPSEQEQGLLEEWSDTTSKALKILFAINAASPQAMRNMLTDHVEGDVPIDTLRQYIPEGGALDTAFDELTVWYLELKKGPNNSLQRTIKEEKEWVSSMEEAPTVPMHDETESESEDT